VGAESKKTRRRGVSRPAGFFPGLNGGSTPYLAGTPFERLTREFLTRSHESGVRMGRAGGATTREQRPDPSRPCAFARNSPSADFSPPPAGNAGTNAGTASLEACATSASPDTVLLVPGGEGSWLAVPRIASVPGW
jgi:hypothetical protein